MNISSSSPSMAAFSNNQHQSQPQPNNNQQQRLRLRNFKKIRDLGRGAYGICGLYKDETSRVNKKVVIKRVSLECKTETEKRHISGEIFRQN
jgi:hypothetical protein